MACSVVTPRRGHGGEAGLAEMERVSARAGAWSSSGRTTSDWLADRGYQHVSFHGPMSMSSTACARR